MGRVYDAIRVPTAEQDDEFVPPPTTTGIFSDGTFTNCEGFYILFTGCQPNTIVATIDIGFAGEFMPTSTALPVAVMDTSEPGTATT
jgi:hypothetical protein